MRVEHSLWQRWQTQSIWDIYIHIYIYAPGYDDLTKTQPYRVSEYLQPQTTLYEIHPCTMDISNHSWWEPWHNTTRVCEFPLLLVSETSIERDRQLRCCRALQRAAYLSGIDMLISVHQYVTGALRKCVTCFRAHFRQLPYYLPSNATRPNFQL